MTKLVYSICGVTANVLHAQPAGDPCIELVIQQGGSPWDECGLVEGSVKCPGQLPPTGVDAVKRKGFWQGCCQFCESADGNKKRYKCCNYTDLCSVEPDDGPSVPAWCGAPPWIFYVCTEISCYGEWPEATCAGQCSRHS